MCMSRIDLDEWDDDPDFYFFCDEKAAARWLATNAETLYGMPVGDLQFSFSEEQVGEMIDGTYALDHLTVQYVRWLYKWRLIPSG